MTPAWTKIWIPLSLKMWSLQEKMLASHSRYFSLILCHLWFLYTPQNIQALYFYYGIYFVVSPPLFVPNGIWIFCDSKSNVFVTNISPWSLFVLSYCNEQRCGVKLWARLHYFILVVNICIVEVSVFHGNIHVSWILSAFCGNIHVPWLLSAFHGYIFITRILSAFRGNIHVP